MSKINFFALLLIFSCASNYTDPAIAHAVVTKHSLEIVDFPQCRRLEQLSGQDPVQ